MSPGRYVRTFRRGSILADRIFKTEEFARYAHLNVSPKLVSDWESGVKRPSGPSLKLLALVRTKGLAAIA